MSKLEYSNIIEYKVNNPFIGKEGVITEVYEYNLFENYPNPFNPSTVIKYSIADQTDVKLIVYDILGREIKVLVNDNKEPGNYEINFDASNLASGIYVYRMETKNFTKSHKMMLVK